MHTCSAYLGEGKAIFRASRRLLLLSSRTELPLPFGKV
jgi:hypothetical protein